MAISLPIVSTFDNKGVNSAISAVQGLGSKLIGLGAVVAGAFAVKAVFDFGRESLAAAEAVAQADNRIRAVAKATGIFGAETDKVTDSLIKFAEAQEMRIGVDGEVVKGVQAQLLSFKKLSESAGQTGGVFERVTKAAFDMASAGFGSAESNAIALGKAFEDPIRGLTALRRSGTVFTEEQQNLIKTLVETGDLLGAQEVILNELETQYGGTAEATALWSDRLTLAMDNIKEAAGKALMPAFEEFAKFIIEDVVPPVTAFFEDDFPRILDKAGRAFGALKPVFDDISSSLKDLFNIDQDVSLLEGLLDKIGDFETSGGFGEALESMVDSFNEMAPDLKTLVPQLAELGKIVIPTLVSVLPPLMPLFIFLAQVLATATNALFFWRDSFQKTTDSVPMWAKILGAMSPPFLLLMETGRLLGERMQLLRADIQDALSRIQAAWYVWTYNLRTAISQLWENVRQGWVNIGNSFMAGVNLVTSYVAQLPGRLGSAISGATGVMVDRGRAIMTGLRDGIAGAWGTVSSWVSGIPGRIVSAFGNAGNILYGIGRSIMDGLRNGLNAAWGSVRDWVNDKVRWISDTFARALRIKSPSRVFFDYGQNIVQGLVNGLESLSPKVDVAMTGITPMPDASGFGSMPGGVMGGGGGGITVVVNAGMGTNGAEVGRLVVNAIRDYERRNGQVFAAA